MFLDQTGASTNMVRRTGWNPRSTRVVLHTTHGHWCTTTFGAGLRVSGTFAPWLLDGPINRITFGA